MILDCSSTETIKESLCKIFDTTEEKLLAVLASVEDDYMKSDEDLEFDVDNAVFDEIGEPKKNVQTLWFHGTRIQGQDKNSFLQRGILPTHEIYREKVALIDKQSHSLEKNGESGNMGSFSMKPHVNDKGPYAYLFKYILLYNGSKYKNFTQSPEVIEDIAGLKLGKNGGRLVDLLKEESTACIVSFVADCKESDILTALMFLKRLQDGKTEPNAIDMLNPVGNFNGLKILPNQIVAIEELK